MSSTLSQFFAAQVRATPDAPFVRHNNEAVSYQEMARSAARAANLLVELEVRAGDRVAVQAAKCPVLLQLYLGIMRAGAVLVPLNTAYTAAELSGFIADCEPALVICPPERARDLNKALTRAPRVPRLETLGHGGEGALIERLQSAEEIFEDVVRSPDDPAAILYTSGTTGRSKGAVLSHANLVSNARVLAETWRFTSRDRLVHALPLYHTHGLFTAVNTLIASGASMDFFAQFDVDAVIDALSGASVFMGVPTYYFRLLQSPKLNRDAVRSMRLFISGSAPLSPDIHAQFRDRTGHAVLERYGMTETNMNTSNPYDGERLAGSVGLPLPGVELRITDPKSGVELSKNEIGMIEVRGPNVFSGYWRRPELNATEFRADGFFITGDLGRVDGNGYVWIEGREKDLIISGGLNVYPAEIEAAIDAIPGVAESAVIGLSHDDFGEGVTAIVACAEGREVSVDDIGRALEGQLAAFKRPKRIFLVDALPRNAMGKIQKAHLRETYRNTYLSS